MPQQSRARVLRRLEGPRTPATKIIGGREGATRNQEVHVCQNRARQRSWEDGRLANPSRIANLLDVEHVQRVGGMAVLVVVIDVAHAVVRDHRREEKRHVASHLDTNKAPGILEYE